MKKGLEIIIRANIKTDNGWLGLNANDRIYSERTIFLVGMKDSDNYDIYYENKQLSRNRERKYPQLIRKGYIDRKTVDEFIEIINNLYIPKLNISEGLVNTVSKHMGTSNEYISHMEALSEDSPYYNFREKHIKDNSLTKYEINLSKQDMEQYIIKQSYSGYLYLNYKLYAFDRKTSKIIKIKADYDNDCKRYITKGQYCGVQIPEDEIDYLNRRIRTDKYHGIKHITIQDLIVLYAEPVLN